METIDRLKLRTDETNEDLLTDLLESAKSAIMSRRFPFQKWPDEIEPQYVDLQIRISLDLYNKMGAEGQISHSENGIGRTYESSWISKELLDEIVPYCGVVS